MRNPKLKKIDASAVRVLSANSEFTPVVNTLRQVRIINELKIQKKKKIVQEITIGTNKNDWLIT